MISQPEGTGNTSRILRRFETVRTLEEAREWFVAHSSGWVKCKSNGLLFLAKSYPEAENFFHHARRVAGGAT